MQAARGGHSRSSLTWRDLAGGGGRQTVVVTPGIRSLCSRSRDVAAAQPSSADWSRRRYCDWNVKQSRLMNWHEAGLAPVFCFGPPANSDEILTNPGDAFSGTGRSSSLSD